jgi:endonuclease III
MINPIIPEILIKRGVELLASPFKKINFTKNEKADDLLNDIQNYPHAFVVACLMDRQWKAEKCWLVPFLFKERHGSFEFDDLKRLSLDEVIKFFTNNPPLHRMKEKMAAIFFSAIKKINDQYDCDASHLWEGKPRSATVVRRFLEFNGAGPKISTMAANILVRDFKIPLSDKYSIDISPDVQVKRTFIRLGLLRSNASNEELIYIARELNPMYPGILDLSAWEIGREWCRPHSPNCSKCYMQEYCPSIKIK